jgi:quinol monooxygenase YgiN
MIIATLRLIIPFERRSEVLKTVHLLLVSMRAKPGCISARFYQDIENTSALILVEEWESNAELDQHIRSYEYRKVLALMEMSNELPEVTFDMISRRSGIETIMKVRGEANAFEN